MTNIENVAWEALDRIANRDPWTDPDSPERIAKDAISAIAAMQPAPQEPLAGPKPRFTQAPPRRREAVMQNNRRWQLGDKVKKKANSSWRGIVCGFYNTEATPNGYSVVSLYEPGSVQVWPEAALEDWDGVMVEDELRAEIEMLRGKLREIQDNGDVRSNAIATAAMKGPSHDA